MGGKGISNGNLASKSKRGGYGGGGYGEEEEEEEDDEEAAWDVTGGPLVCGVYQLIGHMVDEGRKYSDCAWLDAYMCVHACVCVYVCVCVCVCVCMRRVSIHWTYGGRRKEVLRCAW